MPLIQAEPSTYVWLIGQALDFCIGWCAGYVIALLLADVCRLISRLLKG